MGTVLAGMAPRMAAEARRYANNPETA